MGRSADIRQLLGSVAVTLISVGMLVGSFLLSQLDSPDIRPSPSQTSDVLAPSATWYLPTLTATHLPTLSPSLLPSATATSAPLPYTPLPSPTTSHLMPSCPQPAGWYVYTVRQGDTLTSLAWRAGITSLALKEANCLSSSVIWPGQQIYLPPAFYASPTPWSCGPPIGWVVYVVRPGDTLYSLSMRFGLGIEAIRRANCLRGYTIRVGQALYLPPLPPAPTQTPLATSTPTLPSSATPLPPTLPPTPSPTQPPTAPASPTATDSPTLTVTPTPAGTAVPTPTYIPTPAESPSPPPTSTSTPTLTPTELPTPTYTATPIPTEPPTSTYTPTPTSTPSG
jgi:LysM repeat protein